MARLTESELRVAAELLKCDQQDVRTVLSKWWHHGKKDRATSLVETARTLAYIDQVISNGERLKTTRHAARD